jgi:formylmethanofuran dehydrogenase subunit A
VVWHAENEGSGGVVPYHYKQASFINALQWAIGLEIFLLCSDPWRLFFTTDHPNGAPFTRYPDLLRLLMDYDYRMHCLSMLPPDIASMTLLPELKTEFSLYDVAVMTRAAPARLLGLSDRGTLRPGAVADIAVYREQQDKSAMFAKAEMVFKNGQLVVNEGNICRNQSGQAVVVTTGYDKAIETTVQNYFDRFYSMRLSNYGVPDSLVETQPARFLSTKVSGRYSS